MLRSVIKHFITKSDQSFNCRMIHYHEFIMLICSLTPEQCMEQERSLASGMLCYMIIASNGIFYSSRKHTVHCSGCLTGDLGGCLLRGCLPRGCLSRGCLPGPRGRHPWTQRQTSPPWTDTCKNITFPQLLLQMVIRTVTKYYRKPQ